MHFCRLNWVDLMETYFKLLQAFFFVVLYWYALENTWSKQVPWKLSSKPKSLQFTTHFNVNVITFKFAPSSFTHVITFFFKPY